MPVDGHQSAYQYRSRRRGVQSDEDDDEPADTKPERKVDALNSKANSLRSPGNKLTADTFFGTVAGRLAQEIHDEFLVCKICFESYTNPKCLSCLHTFCANCIDRHISAEVTYNKYTDYRDFTCPLCRKRTQLPLGGVKRLPDNFLISGLTELVMRQRAPSLSSSSVTLTSTPYARGLGDGLDTASNSLNGDEEADRVNQLPHIGRRGVTYGECEICSQVDWVDRGHSIEPMSRTNPINDSGRASSANLSMTPQASAKCLDCNKLLCTECVKRHRTTKVTKDHATFDLQSGKDIECKEHPGESVRFYCEACSACICVLCTFNEHREHEVASFGEAVACMRSELEMNLEHASQRILHCQARLNSVSEAAELVHNLERQIRETTEQFIEMIQKQEQEILHDLHEFIGARNMNSIDQQADQEQQLETAETLYKEAVKYIEGQEIDMLLAKPDLYAKLDQLNELSLPDSEFDQISSEVYFRPGTVQLGYLTNDMSGPPTEQYDYLHMPLSSSQSSIELANRPCLNTTSTQTDASLLEKLIQKAKPRGEEKQCRSRGCNTDSLVVHDRETNTRPRGINTTISFSEAVSNANSEEFLAQLDASKLDFQSMDNLTRARMRRKLKEHYHTFDESSGANIAAALMMNGNKFKTSLGPSEYALRRYSAIDKQHH
ncbi:hypothetical protein P879_07355 [Paragonimus westermani]|uniref:Tripartite motif-containing protein 2/3 n=1 Tax=Paragonimus westermani TaxID=34504 RepID=A0A8T0DIC9_9TREM|nr:hypothetical protein P879_07355 [Paragonimus westermani]